MTKTKRKTKVLKRLLIIVIVIILCLGVRFIYSYFHGKHTTVDMSKKNPDNTVLACAVFDGTELWEDAVVTIEEGVIGRDSTFSHDEVNHEYFLMPGLVDAHLHITTRNQMEQMVLNGVTTACDVAASQELEHSYEALNVWSARSSIMMTVEDVNDYVETTIAQGGTYIKVVADLPQILGGGIMEQSVLEELVSCAHENQLKVAVHAISVAGIQLAVDSGVDLLIHIPIGETLPQELAEQIAAQEIAVMPTMAMMQAFANSPIYGYQKADDAVAAVLLLHSLDVPILVATDSSDSIFVPRLKHGTTLHKEMQLLVDAGLTPLEVLRGATTKTADAFGIEDIGTITPGEYATMVLVQGRPDQEITDSSNIVQIWVNGKAVLDDSAYSLQMGEIQAAE